MRSLVLLVVLAGCAAPAPATDCLDFRLAPGVTEVCMDGEPRLVALHVPDDPDGVTIIVLHGAGSWGARMEAQTGFHVVAPNAIVAYPEGTPLENTGLFQTWNGVHCCGPAHEDGVDDVAFLAALVDRIEGVGGPQRVLVVGHSNGGMMAHRFAAEQATLVDGLAVVAGTVGGRLSTGADDLRPTTPSAPVHAMLIHGLADRLVPYEGGAGQEAAGGRLDASVMDSTQFWREANSATTPLLQEEGAVSVQKYEGDASVTVLTTTGGHAWPRGQDGLDATVAIVDWFYDL